MNKILLVVFCTIINLITNCMEPRSFYLKCHNEPSAQQQINNPWKLLHALQLLTREKHPGYLMKELNVVYLCVWDRSFGRPNRIHPLYKATLYLKNTPPENSQSSSCEYIFLENKDLHTILTTAQQNIVQRSRMDITLETSKINTIIEILSSTMLMINL